MNTLEIKYQGMPFNYTSAIVTHGDWRTVKRLRENGDVQIIWVKEGEGVHYGQVSVKGGHLSQHPIPFGDHKLHKSEAFREFVELPSSQPVELL